MTDPSRIAIRWTIGNVTHRGFEALRLSIHGAHRLFGPHAQYVVCVNSLPLSLARSRTGPLPRNVQWLDCSADLPHLLRPHLDPHMAQGVGWKLAPLRLFPRHFEISLDNDVLLWDLPPALEQFLSSPDSPPLLAEDSARAFGIFDPFAPPIPLNSGIRGFPPHFNFHHAIHQALCAYEQSLGTRARLSSELDEQGLQAAALSLHHSPLLLPTSDVSICSPFHPHNPSPGRCGAHFVGLNTHHLPFSYYDRPADLCRREHYDHLRPMLYEKLHLPLPPDLQRPLSASA